MISVSIVMPCYNAAKYLHRSIDSILSQTYNNWELIVVNDGSTDESLRILEEYSIRDKRISVITQPNGGVSNARQKGLDNAKGEYVIQFDADDWAEPNYLELLIKKAVESDADMVWCDMYGHDNVRGQYVWSLNCEETPKAIIRRLLDKSIWGGTYIRLFKTEICRRDGVGFPPNCICWEDLAFLVSALLQCKTVVHLPKPLYHYDLSIATSITHKAPPNLLPDGYLIAIDWIVTALNQNHVQDLKYEVRLMQLLALRDYIDCKPIRDYDKFVTTYPDAIEHINEYPIYPRRLKICAWLILRKQKWAVNPILFLYAILRKLGLSSLY